MEPEENFCDFIRFDQLGLMFVSEQLLSQYIFVIFNQWTDFFNITIFYKNRKEKRTATTCINDESKMRAVTKVDFRVGH